VVGVAAAAALLQSAAHLVHVFVLDGRYATLLDADSNRSIFDVVSVVAEATGSAASLALASMRPAQRPRFLALSALLAFVAVDDAISLHTRSRIDWPVILLPVLVCTFLLLWSALDRPEERVFIRSSLLLLAAAVLLGVVGAPALRALGWDAGRWPHALKIVIKQGAELAGWIMISGSLVTAAVLGGVAPAWRRCVGRRPATSEAP
jgi:hypothetical protein